jgi:NAD(P)H-hydrate epimerase
MRSLEMDFMKTSGIPGMLLMEHAAAAVVRHMKGARNALFICGPGNNGGDGLAAARLFAAAGGVPVVWLAAPFDNLSNDAQAQSRILRAMGISIFELTADSIHKIPCVDWIVDALFGTGLSREATGVNRALIELANESGIPVLSIDIPSGIDGGTGRALGPAIRAARTVTFHCPKIGHYIYPGRELAGELIVEPIGIPQIYRNNDMPCAELLEDSDIDALLPARKLDSHKGDYGHALIIAGSLGMAGAAAICAEGAVRGGAGLTTVACDPSIIPIVQTLVPTAMAASLSCADDLRGALIGKRCAAVGPGLSRKPGLLDILSPLFDCALPQVWDADALNLLAEANRKPPAYSILTPHPGEAARLLGVEATDICSSPIESARELSSQTGAVVLLKGAATIIAYGGRLALNHRGSPAMAKGGSGDALTGIITALLAQGLSLFDAARVGAYLHGRAGERACAAVGERAVTALDILSRL